MHQVTVCLLSHRLEKLKIISHVSLSNSDVGNRDLVRGCLPSREPTCAVRIKCLQLGGQGVIGSVAELVELVIGRKATCVSKRSKGRGMNFQDARSRRILLNGVPAGLSRVKLRS